MMMCDFLYFENQEWRRRVQELANLHRHLFPHWVYDVRVEYCGVPGDSDVKCDVSMRPEYREVVIRVFDTFFALKDEDQSRSFVHEVCHALLGMVTEWVREECIEQLSDGQTQAFLDREFTRRVEACVEELAIILHGCL